MHTMDIASLFSFTINICTYRGQVTFHNPKPRREPHINDRHI